MTPSYRELWSLLNLALSATSPEADDKERAEYNAKLVKAFARMPVPEFGAQQESRAPERMDALRGLLLDACVMGTPRFKAIMACVMDIESAAYARGAQEAMVPNG